MINDANPDIFDEIEKLSDLVLLKMKETHRQAKILKFNVAKQVSRIRDCQNFMDMRTLELYDLTVKTNSYLKLCNIQEKVEIQHLNKVRHFYDTDGTRNKEIGAKHFVEEIHTCKKVVTDFFYKLSMQHGPFKHKIKGIAKSELVPSGILQVSKPDH